MLDLKNLRIRFDGEMVNVESVLDDKMEMCPELWIIN